MKTRRAFLLAAVLCMAACIKQLPPTAPGQISQPPQVTILQMDRALADADNVAAKTVATLYGAGSIDLPTAQQAKGYLAAVATASDAVAAECQSADTWPVMRAKIAALLASLGVQVSPLQPDLKVKIGAVQALVTQILGVQ